MRAIQLKHIVWLGGLLLLFNLYNSASAEELEENSADLLSRHKRAVSPTFRLGPQGRTEEMTVTIYPRDLNTGTAASNAARKKARSWGKKDDDAGHIVAKRLGGSGSDLRNIFPQNPNKNRGQWRTQEGKVFDLVKKHNGVRYYVKLIYANRNAKRPTKFNYRVNKIKGGGKALLSGTISNP